MGWYDGNLPSFPATGSTGHCRHAARYAEAQIMPSEVYSMTPDFSVDFNWF